MSTYYGFSITDQGEELIASLLAGDTLGFTKIMAGDGDVPDESTPATMTDLTNPLLEGTSTTPTVSGSTVSMVLEFRNDDLDEGFWLKEFGIYASTATEEDEEGKEILFAYGTLGSYPQWICASSDTGVDVRRFPIAFSIGDAEDITIDWSAQAWVTAEDVEELLDGTVTTAMTAAISSAIAEHDADTAAHAYLLSQMQSMVDAAGASITEITFAILTADWTESDDEYYALQNDLYLDAIEEDMVPVVIIDHETEHFAYAAELCRSAETYDGYIRFWCQNTPAQDITGTLLLIKQGGTSYVLPVATSSTLGGVKVGSGLSVSSDGTLSISTASDDDVEDLYE